VITHYDLFAGIGGFSYALDTIFNDHDIKHIFCEWERFPTAILKKHWPEGIFYGDIRDLIADTDITGRERVGREDEGRHGQRSREVQDKKQEMVILTGGFPCQPFSQAGRRQGTSDDRYLWPEMFRVIQNVKPDWVIAENVRGLVTWNEGMVLETVCADLESEGYEVQPLVIPAVAIGAPHRRDRVWIVAHAKDADDRRNTRKLPSTYEQQATERQEERTAEPSSTSGRQWEQDWREVALATCYDGVDDGLPRWMDGTTISAARHRKERLKACGNAIVPQVAMEIFTAIKLSAPTPSEDNQ
jgi:DNA (cytosine-5)-methyltransferase 1